MKTDKDAAESYADEKARNGDEWLLITDTFEAGCKHKEESRWIPVSEMAAHNQYAWVSNGPNGYVLWACYAELVGWFDESGKQIHGVTQYWPVIKPTPPQTNK